MHQCIDGVALNNAFTVGYLNLKKNITLINDLNVFPVPDGDTGTNMTHTFLGGLSAVEPKSDVDVYSNELAQAVLLSARGNSGVIFSQIISGLARGLSGKKSVCFNDLKEAFLCAKEDAYNSIMEPTEGTILTVIREASEFLDENAENYKDFQSGFKAIVDCMKATLARTPDMLPVLKEAEVVDSGGAGLVCFFEGMLLFFNGESIDDVEEISVSPASSITTSNFGPDSVMEYGYCTEFILQLMNAKTDIANFSRDGFLKPLESLGDSIVCVANGGIVKVHIHTFTPEKVLAYARNFGEFVTLKIENMSVQHSETQTVVKKPKMKYAVVTVASGEGMIDYFKSIGATAVINGGQTNNPSVDDFLKAFEEFEAEHIILLPNNSNIILTANQVAQIYKDSDVRVIPTKSVVEGYSAISMMDLWADSVEDLISDMTSGLENVISAYITTATRDANLNGVEIKKGQYLGLKNKDIILSKEDRYAAVIDLIHEIMSKENKSVIIVFYGKNVGVDEMEELYNYLEEIYPLVDLGFIEGKQDIYDYIISME